jgi:hypothetical protein
LQALHLSLQCGHLLVRMLQQGLRRFQLALIPVTSITRSLRQAREYWQAALSGRFAWLQRHRVCGNACTVLLSCVGTTNQTTHYELEQYAVTTRQQP